MSTNGKPTGNKGGSENLRPWKPGQSGNPTGRPKGISRQAQELAGGNPDRLLSVLLTVAENPEAKDSDRIAATREYLDRGWGKAPAYAPIEGQDPLELTDFDRHISTLVDELARRREAKAPHPIAGGGVGGHSENGATSS